MSLLFNILSRLLIVFLPRSKRLNFMAAVTICSGFGAQENKVCHCFHCFPIYLPWSDWGQEEKGTTEDEMAGWHHRLDGRESGWTPGVGDEQGGLACCDSWGHKESDTTERLNWTELMGLDAMILVFWMLNFKSTFSLSSFTFIKRLFSSSSFSATRVVSSAYLRLLIFLPKS